jgi:tRNA(fMet)-specific endonuclease VapC
MVHFCVAHPSVMTRAELLNGLKRLPLGHRLHAGVRQFLKIVRALPWDAEAADFYAEIRYQLAAAGAVLVTNNTRHYQRIPAPLLLENWWN